MSAQHSKENGRALPRCRRPGHADADRGRSAWSAILLSLALSLLAGCACGPPDRLLHLRAAPPVAAGAAAAAEIWLIQQPVRLPDYLDRDALLLREGRAGLQRLPGYRWAEPLRDSVPRLLRADLARLLGEDRVWTLPLPAGVQPRLQLRVELLAFEAEDADTADTRQRQVVLQARWSLARADGSAPPQAQAVSLQVPVSGPGADALAAAHRLAVWRLAERIALTRGNPQ